MLRIKGLLDRPPSLMTNGDERGITAEFPFPMLSMLLQVQTEDYNTNLGHGLLTLLRLSDNPGDALPGDCLEINERELASLTRSYFVGSWCDDPQGLRTFVTFLPNVLFSPATIERMVVSDAMRAMWVSQDLLGYFWAENYERALARKTNMFLTDLWWRLNPPPPSGRPSRSGRGDRAGRPPRTGSPPTAMRRARRSAAPQNPHEMCRF